MLTINKSEFTNKHPEEEGQYLCLWPDSGRLDVYSITFYEGKHAYGAWWDGYFGVVEMRGKNVKQLECKFLKIEIGE